MRTRGHFLLLLCLLLLTTLVYSNHFDNSFQFDDAHTVENNSFIRRLHNVPRFFYDAATFSTLRDHQMYRPLVSASLALDYWLGGGLESTFYFHLSSFIWYLVLIVVVFLLFRNIMERTQPGGHVPYAALFGSAWFALHPVSAETVNYVVQRGDLYSTLGVTAGLAAYAAFPRARRSGLYLLPVVLGALAKPPTIMFAPILFVFALLFEEHAGFDVWRRETLAKAFAALRRATPAFLVCAGLYLLQARMTPPTFDPGGASRVRYIITQPYAAFHYAKSLFLPTELSADTDWEPLTTVWGDEGITGVLFVLLMLVWACRSAAQRETRPIAFGVAWFFIAMVPTAVVPLAEVVNDHRIFFPIIGLILAVVWRAALFLAAAPSVLRTAAIAAGAALLPCYAYGAYLRNEVWHSEESLWRDVTIKSPRNGRGLMNYGLALMAKGDYRKSLEYYQQALVFTPAYSVLEINLGIAHGALRQRGEAERHFLRALSLAPATSQPHFYYARWLWTEGRTDAAVAQLRLGLQKNPYDFDARYLLMEIYGRSARKQPLQALVEETLALNPGDSRALQHLKKSEL